MGKGGKKNIRSITPARDQQTRLGVSFWQRVTRFATSASPVESAVRLGVGVIFGLSIGLLIAQLVLSTALGPDGLLLPDSSVRAYRSLDGLPIDGTATSTQPIAVILENHVESRPVAGLEEASIIYETIVEGDITRFLAIFAPGIEAKKIGPVRSVRPFFARLASEWNPVLFHAGGSADGLAAVEQRQLLAVNEISSDGIYFWRDPLRQPPHNLYTSADQMRRAIAAKEWEATENFQPWKFIDGVPAGFADPLPIGEVSVSFSTNPEYQVVYRYNPATNDYTRYLNGTVHVTSRGIILKTDNIIRQYVDVEILDDYGRLAIDLDSGGEAEIFMNGREIEGGWEVSEGRTRFYDLTGKEIEFVRGRVWVELVFNSR